MPWKSDYTISDEVADDLATLAWPTEQKACMTVTVDLNPATGPQGISVEDLRSQEFYFGMHEGLTLLLDLFASLGTKVTFAAPALILEIYPDRIGDIVSAGHELASNGLLGEDANTLDLVSEDSRMGQTLDIFRRVVGLRPRGWYGLPRGTDSFATGSISPNTMPLLIKNGFTYFGNGLADDAPHYCVTDFDDVRPLLMLPYNYSFDDRFFLMFPIRGTGLERADALLRNWEAQFAAQFRRGRCFTMTISPMRSGWGHRYLNLERFLRQTREFPGVWQATSVELAEFWIENRPSRKHLRLSASIWRDYAGSLS